MLEQPAWKRLVALVGLVIGLAGFIGGAVIMTSHRGWGLGFALLGLGFLVPSVWSLYCHYKDAHEIAKIEKEREASRHLIETLEAEHPNLSGALDTPPIIEPTKRFWPLVAPIALVLAGVGGYFLATAENHEVDANTVSSTSSASSSTSTSTSKPTTSSSSATSSATSAPSSTQPTEEPTPVAPQATTVAPSPARPVQTQQSAQPNQPAQPAQPEQPTQPAQPEQPAPQPSPTPTPEPDPEPEDPYTPPAPWPMPDPPADGDPVIPRPGDVVNPGDDNNRTGLFR